MKLSLPFFAFYVSFVAASSRFNWDDFEKEADQHKDRVLRKVMEAKSTSHGHMNSAFVNDPFFANGLAGMRGNSPSMNSDDPAFANRFTGLRGNGPSAPSLNGKRKREDEPQDQNKRSRFDSTFPGFSDDFFKRDIGSAWQEESDSPWPFAKPAGGRASEVPTDFHSSRMGGFSSPTAWVPSSTNNAPRGFSSTSTRTTTDTTTNEPWRPTPTVTTTTVVQPAKPLESKTSQRVDEEKTNAELIKRSEERARNEQEQMRKAKAENARIAEDEAKKKMLSEKEMAREEARARNKALFEQKMAREKDERRQKLAEQQKKVEEDARLRKLAEQQKTLEENERKRKLAERQDKIDVEKERDEQKTQTRKETTNTMSVAEEQERTDGIRNYIVASAGQSNEQRLEDIITFVQPILAAHGININDCMTHSTQRDRAIAILQQLGIKIPEIQRA